MSPAEKLELSVRDYPPPLRKESPIQLIQGWYYLIVGLWVGIGLATLQSPTVPTMGLSHEWLVRCVGFVLAVVGVGLIRASRQKECSSFTIWGAITLTIVIAVAELVSMMNDQLPPTFLMDTGMELGVLSWWVIALYYGDAVVRHAHSQGELRGHV